MARTLMSYGIMVGPGQMKVGRKTGAFTSVGLGSGIGICAYDVETQIGGLARIVFPMSNGRQNQRRPAAFADVAVAALLAAIRERGARSVPKFAVVGGADARMSELPLLAGLGARNAQAVMELLYRLGIEPRATHTGGSYAHSLSLNLATGEVSITRPECGEVLLCKLA